MAASRRFNGIDVSDQVRDRDVRRGQLFYVAFFRCQVCNRRCFSSLPDFIAAASANRLIGIVMDLTARYVWHCRIKQGCQRPQDPALCLPTQPEQNEVVPREYCIHDLGHHSIVIADDSRKDRAGLTQPFSQIVT